MRQHQVQPAGEGIEQFGELQTTSYILKKLFVAILTLNKRKKIYKSYFLKMALILKKRTE